LPELPPALSAHLNNLPGFDPEVFKEVHQKQESITSIRLNSAKWKKYGGKKQPVSYLPLAGPVPWCEQGFYLSQRLAFTLDPLLHAGAYYVQEASSMFVEQFLLQSADLSQSLKVLDLCAAPGGKSTLLQSLLSSDSLLVSNEVISGRNNILAENITRWGANNMVLTQNDPSDFRQLGCYFDIILVDAPCSGSGLFRKSPDAVKEWSMQHVTLCSQRQQRILANVWPALKENGLLIYTTCSYSKEENEDILDWMLENFTATSVSIQLNEKWNIITSHSDLYQGTGYRFYPYLVKGEGFFAACICKQEKTKGAKAAFKKKKTALPPVKEMNNLESWLNLSPDISCLSFGNNILLFPNKLIPELEHIMQALYIRQAGVIAGQFKGHQFIPEHALALSRLANLQLPFLALNQEQALKYLSRKEMSITSGVNGWNLIKYENFPLGWVKILPNRINNYYPMNQRILQILQEE
jgi:16S rRNA C967 or C1407 C5-methylase (RsmB/RsmF family)/NOL1/NOP2/fmu family ribosome biogenesis protein